LADVEGRPWGGYANAERCRLRVGRPESLDEDSTGLASCVAAIMVEGNFIFDTATHRDFLGALLNTGLDRRCIGDIVVLGERGAQVLCTPEKAVYLASALTQVRSVPVRISPLALEDLRVQPPKVDVINSVEASLRLDAIASGMPSRVPCCVDSPPVEAHRSPLASCVSTVALENVGLDWRGGCPRELEGLRQGRDGPEGG